MIEMKVEIQKGTLLDDPAKFQRANKAGLERVVTQVQNIAERKVNAIRKRRVPTRLDVAQYNQKRRIRKGKARALRASSQPAWVPTGNLAKAVKAEPKWNGPNEVALTADVAYGGSRHELGVSWFPKKPALGIVRWNPFFAEAIEVTSTQTQALYEDGFRTVSEEK